MHRCNSRCRDGHHHHPSMEYSSYSSGTSNLPNPDKFEIKDVHEYGKYKVLVVHYPGCTNFKGDKCMVVECSMVDLVKTKRLDPHFDHVKPTSNIKIVARFAPDAAGIEMAKNFAHSLENGTLGPKAPERGGPWDR